MKQARKPEYYNTADIAPVMVFSAKAQTDIQDR